MSDNICRRKLQPCIVCENTITDKKICKICGNIHSEYPACEICTQVVGGFLGFLGKRYCLKCIVILCESREFAEGDSNLSEIVKDQDKLILRYSEQKVNNPRNPPVHQNHYYNRHNPQYSAPYPPSYFNRSPPQYSVLQHRNPGLIPVYSPGPQNYPQDYMQRSGYRHPAQTEEEIQLLKAIEESKRMFEEGKAKESEILAYEYHAPENYREQYPNLENDENDDEIKKVLQESKMLFDSEKRKRDKEVEEERKRLEDIRNFNVFEEKGDMQGEQMLVSVKNGIESLDLLGLEQEIKAPLLSNERSPKNFVEPEQKSKALQIAPPVAPPPPGLREFGRPVALKEAEVAQTNPAIEYELIKKLANGSMGTIYIGKKIGTSDHFAVKIIETTLAQEQTLILNEFKLTINSYHPNIIKYHKCYHFENKFWIIEELMACSLADIILDMPGQIPERIISFILKSIVLAINYLHCNNRMHRDIKSDNVLLDLKGSIKLGDLGFAAQLDNQNSIRNTFAGTLLWMSPELLNQKSYTFKTDIWSLGIVAYELAEGEPPYYREGQQKIITNILNQEPPRLSEEQKWSREFVDFVKRCLVKDSEYRAGIGELVQHPFIKGCETSEEEFQGFINQWSENR